MFLITTKLSDKVYGDILEKYEAPANCTNLCLNAAIWASLQPKTRLIEKKIQTSESRCKGIVALTQDLKDINDSPQDSLVCLANAVF